MPQFQTAATFVCSPTALFDFLARPANLLRTSPPELSFEIVQAPERLELGSVVIIKARRMGTVQRIITSVTKFEADRLIVDQQTHGPFRRFVRTQQLEADGDRVRLSDRVDFDPPGGVLGLLVSADRIARDLAWLSEYRLRALKQLLEAPEPR